MRTLKVAILIIGIVFCSVDGYAQASKMLHRDLSDDELKKVDIGCYISGFLTFVVTNGNAHIELTSMSVQVTEGSATSNHKTGLRLAPYGTSAPIRFNIPVAFRRNGDHDRGVMCKITSATTPRVKWPFSQ